jgi:hypothetical protein
MDMFAPALSSYTDALHPHHISYLVHLSRAHLSIPQEWKVPPPLGFVLLDWIDEFDHQNGIHGPLGGPCQ